MLRKLFGNQHRLLIFNAAGWMLYGILSVMRYRKTGDEFLLWSGIIIGALHAFVLIGLLLKKEKVRAD